MGTPGLTPPPVRLEARHARALDQLLAADPLSNVYLRSELRLAGAASGLWWGVLDGARLRAGLLGGPLAVPWMPDACDAPALAEALERQLPPRMMVGPREQILTLHAARPGGHVAREVREPQLVLALQRGHLRVAPAPEVQLTPPGLLGQLTVAAAAMHREEMGVDPLATDPSAWRTRMTTLIGRGWSWVWVNRHGEILFKAELSALTPEYAQIQGVWSHPAHRGQGLATSGLAAVCASVLRTVPAVTLYVNHYNAAARAVYHRLGFTHAADYATVMY